MSRSGYSSGHAADADDPFGAPIRRSPRRETAGRGHAAHAGGSSDGARHLPRTPDRDGPRARVRRGRPPAQRGRRAALLRGRRRAGRSASSSRGSPRRSRAHGRGEVQYRVRGAHGTLYVRERAAADRDGTVVGVIEDVGSEHERLAARRDDRAAADRARGAPLHRLVRRRGHLPRDLPEPERRTRSWAASRRTRTPRTGWPRSTRRTGPPTRRSWRRRVGREREHRVPPVRRRRRDALDARALQEPGAAGRRDRGHRDRDGHLLEPRRGRRARRQRGQARARAQGRRRLRLRARAATRTATGTRSARAPTASASRAGAASTATRRAASGSTSSIRTTGPTSSARPRRSTQRHAVRGVLPPRRLRRRRALGARSQRPLRHAATAATSASAWCSTSATAASSSAACSRASTSCAAPTPSCASCACRPSSRRAPMSSRARTTGSRSASTSRSHSRPGTRAGSCCSTSTTSSRSTTRSATAPATACSSRSRAACATAASPHDCVARWGGEEFAVLLRDVGDERELARRAVELQRAIDSAPIVVDGEYLTVEVSGGVDAADARARASTRSSSRPTARSTPPSGGAATACCWRARSPRAT